MAIWPEK